MVNDSRIREIVAPVTEDQLSPLTSDCLVVQFSSPLGVTDHEKLGNFMKNNPTILLRAYGHYSIGLKDLSFLKHYPTIKKFQVDVFELKSTAGVEYLPNSLEFFSFGRTRKSFSVGFVTQFKTLQSLTLEGHISGIASIGALENLESLTLKSVTLDGLSILAPLRKLKKLQILLGGTTDLTMLGNIKSLECLMLWMVRGLSDISPISRLFKLQTLQLHNLKNVSVLPDLTNCAQLKTIVIDMLPKMNDLRPLLSAEALEDLTFIGGSRFVPADFICLKKHEALKSARIGLGSVKKNKEVQAILSLPALTE
jgi:Leucine-rich repeat (LRR) protein